MDARQIAKVMRDAFAKPCPRCGGPTEAVMCVGLPARACMHEECGGLMGLGEKVASARPAWWNGVFVPYDGTVIGFLKTWWWYILKGRKELR